MSRSTIYTHRGRTPRNCYTCDGLAACKCDRVTMRAAKRSAKQRWRRADELEAEKANDPSSGPHARGSTGSPIDRTDGSTRHL